MATATATGDLPQRMRRVIRGLAATRDEGAADLARALGMHESKLFRRFQQGKWTAEELTALAAHFDVPIGVLFSDPRDVFGGGSPVANGRYSLVSAA